MDKKLTAKIIAGVVSAGLTMCVGTALAKHQMEKCYGVAKAGKNSCGGKHVAHSCQGQSKVDCDPNDWVLVKKGHCKKMTCKVDGKVHKGSLMPGYEMMNKK